MTKHRIGTREEWLAAREALLVASPEQAGDRLVLLLVEAVAAC